ncbi:hypothetical protein [Dysgonomonas termitidis]|uniref:Uncharacterized protein n=1 Tax=Dysgonomonas termitidis TaxID=1516126 RepID=A0ABV9KQQ9_9BACT
MKQANYKQKHRKGVIFKILSLLVAILAMSPAIHAQVTIGSNTEPNNGAMLDVKNNDNTVNANGGINFPRVLISDFTPTTDNDFAASIGATDSWDRQKHIGLVVYNTGTPAGLHIWNGTQWTAVGGGSGASPWNISGTSNAATSNTDNIYQMGSVSVGISGAADPTAALNVVSTNKGVLLPRVELTSSTDNVTIPNPTTGLLVYNTGANTSFTTVGYMFWDGSQWRLFANASSEAGSATLNCAGAQMSPGQQIVDATAIIAGTVLQVPYTGGNGGSFNGATLVSTGNPGVTATIAGSMLSVGNGVLNFSLSGTPTLDQQAPNGITFDLTPFLNANTDISGCNQVTVGNTLTASIEETAVMGNFMLVTDNTGNDTGTRYYALQCNSPDGKFSIRAEVPVTQTSVRSGNQYLNVQVRNNQSSAVPVIWNFNTDYGGSLSTMGVLTIPSQRWGGDQDSGNSWTNATGSNTSNGAYWGQVGIYDGENNGPEYRRYTWIPIGANNKVCYEATIMVALDTTTPATAVHPTLIKCYIKFSQVTAQ